MTAFNPGDKVRLTALYPASGSIESTVDGNGQFVGWAAWNNAQADVEIVERADDPSKDPVGTTRKDPETGNLFARLDDVDEDWRSLTRTYVSYRPDREVVGWEKGLPIPGTPAAGHVPDEVVEETRKVLTERGKIPAIKHFRDAVGTGHQLYSLRQAKDFVEALEPRNPFA